MVTGAVRICSFELGGRYVCPCDCQRQICATSGSERYSPQGDVTAPKGIPFTAVDHTTVFLQVVQWFNVKRCQKHPFQIGLASLCMLLQWRNATGISQFLSSWVFWIQFRNKQQTYSPPAERAVTVKTSRATFCSASSSFCVTGFSKAVVSKLIICSLRRQTKE